MGFLISKQANINFNNQNTYGFFVSWGLNISFNSKRTLFLKRWRKHELPTKGIISSDFNEPPTNKRRAITLSSTQATLASSRPDGSICNLVVINSNKYKLIRLLRTNDNVKQRNPSNVIMFTGDDPDGPYLFKHPELDIDVRLFMSEQYEHTLTHIETTEARKYIVALLNEYCFASLTTQKGGMYYVDYNHWPMIKKLINFMDSFHTTLGLFPVLKGLGSDLNSLPFLQEIVGYQMRRYFKIKTASIKRASKGQPMSNILIGRYLSVLESILLELRFYADKYDLQNVLLNLKNETKTIKRQLKNGIVVGDSK